MTLGGSLFALLDSGLLPGVGVGAVGSVRVNAGRVSGEFSGRFLLPRSTNIEGDPNRGGTFNWVGAGLEACLRVLPPLHTCFGAEVGGLTGEGIGVDTPFTRTATMVDLTGGAVGRVDIGSDFALEARLGVAVPMDRPQFGLEGFGDLHQPDSVSLRAGFGVAFR
jgi:hypothetical protein